MTTLSLQAESAFLEARQDVNDTDTDIPFGWVDDDGLIIPFFATKTGIIVKWSLFFGLFLLLGLYVVLGHMHARRRIRKGLKPFAYHRWMVPRADLARVDPRYAFAMQPAGVNSYRGEYYGMTTMAPPPTYDPSAPRPPKYDGPDGATKVDPSQRRDEPTHRPADNRGDGEEQEFSAPPGPLPTVRTDDTGRSNNPWRL